MLVRRHEVSQFTYFQQVAGVECAPVAASSPTARAACDVCARRRSGLRSQFNGREAEKVNLWRRVSAGRAGIFADNFEHSDADMLFKQFSMRGSLQEISRSGMARKSKARRQSQAASDALRPTISASRQPCLQPADARGVISVMERQSYIMRVRELAKLRRGLGAYRSGRAV